MPQTPKSISVPLAGAAATAYTVPGGATAVLKTALGQNVVGGNSLFTIQKLAGGAYSPLIINQTPTIQAPTGGTTFNSKNLIDGPITLTAGDSLVVADSSSPQWKFPSTSNTFTSTVSSSYGMRNMLYANGVYIQVGFDGSNSCSMLLRSTDANTWTEIATGNLLGSAATYYMANIGNTWVVGQHASINYMYSVDNGLTWTAATMPAGANIYDISSDGSTRWVMCTGLGVYTSTSIPTWTLNTILNNLINTSFSSTSNPGYAPSVASWNGTYWFIANWYGTWSTTNFTTFSPIYGPFGGSSFNSGFQGVRWSSVYSKYYAVARTAINSADIVSSSTNGISWTLTLPGTNVFNNTSRARVNVAGSNPVLIANAPLTGSTSLLKSTDGSTWTSATDIRGYTGMCEGLANGYFIRCASNGVSGNFYITTDPTTSTGVQFTVSAGSNASFRAAASNGTGWVLIFFDTSVSVTRCANGTTPTTLANTGSLVDSSGSYSFYNVVWWPAANLYVAVDTSGYIFTSPDGAAWTMRSSYAGVLQSNPSPVIVGNFLYLVSTYVGGGSGWIGRLSASELAADVAPTTVIPSTPAYGTLQQGYTWNNNCVNEIFSAGALSSNGTDILISNTRGSTSMYTPSVGNVIRTPPGSNGVIVERVNGLDMAYTTYTQGGGNTRGFFYASDIVSSVPTASNTVGGSFSIGSMNGPNSNPPSAGIKIVFYGGTYYVANDDDSISSATNLRIFTNYSWSATTIGRVPAVLPYTNYYTVNRIQSDGTNFLTFNASNNSVLVYKGTNPSSTLASSTVTFGLVEIT